MNFDLVDHGQDDRVTPEVLARIARGVTNQLVEFCSAWDRSPSEVRPKASDGVAIHIFRNTTLANALGFHSVDTSGKPYACVFTDGLSLFDGPDSIACVCSHEVLEAKIDPNCNLWFQDREGRKWAGEVCDPVERKVYVDLETGISLSNYVKSSFFDTLYFGADVDRMGILTAGFTLDPENGYAVLTMPDGSRVILPTNMAFGAMAPKKQHHASRTYHRLMGLTK